MQKKSGQQDPVLTDYHIQRNKDAIARAKLPLRAPLSLERVMEQENRIKQHSEEMKRKSISENNI